MTDNNNRFERDEYLRYAAKQLIMKEYLALVQAVRTPARMSEDEVRMAHRALCRLGPHVKVEGGDPSLINILTTEEDH